MFLDIQQEYFSNDKNIDLEYENRAEGRYFKVKDGWTGYKRGVDGYIRSPKAKQAQDLVQKLIKIKEK